MESETKRSLFSVFYILTLIAVAVIGVISEKYSTNKHIPHSALKCFYQEINHGLAYAALKMSEPFLPDRVYAELQNRLVNLKEPNIDDDLLYSKDPQCFHCFLEMLVFSIDNNCDQAHELMHSLINMMMELRDFYMLYVLQEHGALTEVQNEQLITVQKNLASFANGKK